MPPKKLPETTGESLQARVARAIRGAITYLESTEEGSRSSEGFVETQWMYPVIPDDSTSNIVQDNPIDPEDAPTGEIDAPIELFSTTDTAAWKELKRCIESSSDENVILVELTIQELHKLDGGDDETMKVIINVGSIPPSNIVKQLQVTSGHKIPFYLDIYDSGKKTFIFYIPNNLLST